MACPEIRQLINNSSWCRVIPKCFVKDGKVAEKMTEEEKATVDTSEKMIQQQMNTNLKLKQIKLQVYVGTLKNAKTLNYRTCLTKKLN